MHFPDYATSLGFWATVFGFILAVFVASHPLAKFIQKQTPRSVYWCLVCLLISVGILAWLFLSLFTTNSYSSQAQGSGATPTQGTYQSQTPISTHSPATASGAPQPNATATAIALAQCTYSKHYEDSDLHTITAPVPQGCYGVVSSYNGNLISPDSEGISQGALVAYQGQVTIQVKVQAQGGVTVFLSETEAKSYYCAIYNNPKITHDITQTPSSLNWGPTC